MNSSRFRQALFLFSGLIPLLGLLSRPPTTALLVYTLFVAASFLRPQITRAAERLPGPPAFHLVLFFLLAGCLTETLAWLNNYLAVAREPALFHPQLFADLVLGIGFYGGWAAAWLLVLRRFRFTLAETFLVTGIQGIFFEQLGAVFIMMVAVFLANPLQSVLFGLYVCAVHGSAVGLALLPVLHRLDHPENSRSWRRFPAAIVLMVGLAFVGTALVAGVAALFGGLPPRRSIITHPFW